MPSGFYLIHTENRGAAKGGRQKEFSCLVTFSVASQAVNHKNEVKLRPLLCRPLKLSMTFSDASVTLFVISLQTPSSGLLLQGERRFFASVRVNFLFFGRSQNGQTIRDPHLDLQEINGVQEIPSQKRSRHPKCLALQCFGAMRGGGEIHGLSPINFLNGSFDFS